MLTLQTTGAEADAESRAFAEFFNAAHSVEAVIDDVKLAVWCSGRPLSWQIDGSRPVAWFGWLESGHLNTVRAPVAYVNEHPEALGSLRYVALATPDLEQSAPMVWRGLLGAGYQPRLPQQITGWYLDEYAAADSRPSHRPSLALLPERGSDAWHTACCLVLVEVNYVWLVLSERGASAYSHGSRLIEGDPVRFLAEDDSRPVELVRADGVPPDELEARFGAGLLDPDAGALGIARARPDATALAVRVK